MNFRIQQLRTQSLYYDVSNVPDIRLDQIALKNRRLIIIVVHDCTYL